MSDVWWEAPLALLLRVAAPLTTVVVTFQVLRGGLDWPPTVAALAGLLAGACLELLRSRHLGQRLSLKDLARVYGWAVAAWAAALCMLVLARGLLVRLGWLPGSAVVLGMLVGWAVARVLLARYLESGGERFVRGRAMTPTAKARRQLRQAVAKETNEAAVGRPVWAGEQLPLQAAALSYLAAGMPGSGKTTLIASLMNSVLPSVGRGHGCRALVYDDKQEYVARLHGIVDPARLVLLNPLDQRSYAWDIAADVTDYVVALQLATVFIPPEPHSTQPFFTDSARKLMAEVMHVFMTRTPKDWTFRDVVLACSTYDALRRVLNATWFGQAALETTFGARRSGGDIMSTLGTKLAYLPPLAAGWEAAARERQRVSLTNWVNGEGVLVLSGDPTVRQSLDAVNQILLNRATQLLLGRPEPVTDRTWVFLDELREGPLFSDAHCALNQGRTKGLSLVIGFQTLEGMEARYGEKEARELISGCEIRAFLRMESEATCRWASDSIGQSEFLRYERSFSPQGISSAERLVEKALVLPSQLRSLPRPEQTGRLCGWYITPFTGAFYRELLRADTARLMPQPAVDEHGNPVPNATRRPARDLELAPWTEEDYRRLALPPLPPESKQRKPKRKANADTARNAEASADRQEPATPGFTLKRFWGPDHRS